MRWLLSQKERIFIFYICFDIDVIETLAVLLLLLLVSPFFLDDVLSAAQGRNVFITARRNDGMNRKYKGGLAAELMAPAITLVF